MTKRISEKRFGWGGRALAAAFPAGGAVSLTGSIAAGSRSTKDDELAEVHAQMLLEGTKMFKKKDLQIELDAMGASLSFSSDGDRLAFSGKARTVHAGRLLALVAEALQNPTFPSAELEILKKREQSNLAMQAQDTRAQASIALSRMLFKKDHPNYEQTTQESLAALKKITQKQLRAYHQKVLNRGSLVLAMAGDVTPAKVFELTQKYFAPLPDTTVRKEKTPPTPAPKAQKKATYIKEKASIDYFAAVAPRITDTHEDYPALVLGLQVLGNRGGFTGRLMRIVREQEGLTYGVYSYPSGFEHYTDGYAAAWGTFAPQLFDKGRAAVLREIKRIVTEGVGNKEVRKHGKLFEARARVSLSNSGALARAAHDTVVNHKPLSHIETFPKRVARLTAREVNKVLKKYLRPNLLSEAAAGPIDNF